MDETDALVNRIIDLTNNGEMVWTYSVVYERICYWTRRNNILITYWLNDKYPIVQINSDEYDMIINLGTNVSCEVYDRFKEIVIDNELSINNNKSKEILKVLK